MVDVMKNKARNVKVDFSENYDGFQVVNNTGGMVYKNKDVDTLIRFLVLGTEGGSYYVGERKMTDEAVKSIKKMIASDEEMVLATVVDVSSTSRAPKNTYALYVMAMLMTHGKNKVATREALPQVARTATHLFEFVSYLNDMGGMGSSKRKAIAGWYTSKPAEQIAYQAIKYRSRSGYTHRDLFRISHPEGVDKTVGEFILRDRVVLDAPDILVGYSLARKVESGAEAVKVLKEFPNLPWEAFPTTVHGSAQFWKTLFYNGMGATALVRNITRFAKLGMFEDMVFTGDVAKAIVDEKNITKGRMHPVQYLNAWGVAKKGKINNEYYGYASRTKEANVPSKITNALEKAFFKSFGNVESSGARTMIAIDVSGSMTWQSPAGLVGVDCMEAAAIMSLVTASTEDYVETYAFSGGWRSTGLSKIDLEGSKSIQEAINEVGRVASGGTNVGLPIEHALQNKTKIDTFIVYTDNEVNHGYNVQSLLDEYRKKINSEARLIVVGMSVSEFTVGNPDDKKILNVAGFDAAAPRIMADFSAGRL